MKLVLIILLFTSNHLCILSESQPEPVVSESRKNDITIPTSFGQNIKVSLGDNINALSVDGHVIQTSKIRKLATLYPYSDEQLTAYLDKSSSGISDSEDKTQFLTDNIPVLQATMVAIQASLQNNPNSDLEVSPPLMAFIIAELKAIQAVFPPEGEPATDSKKKMIKASLAAKRVNVRLLRKEIRHMSRHLKN